MEDFRNRRISVIGAARSGLSAARVLVELGADVLLSDGKTAEQLGAARVAEIEETRAAFVLGASSEMALPDGTKLVVTSPGVPRNAPVLLEAVRRDIPIWSEIELAYRITDAPIVAVTGTNGKTTTVLLIAAMLDAAGIPNIVCGNVSADEIKRSLTDAADATRNLPENELPVLVAEISSFQLEWVHEFRPKVGVLTNITPDHMDRYENFADYQATKARMFEAQTPEDWAVINHRDLGARGAAQLYLFKPERPHKILWLWRFQRSEYRQTASVQDGIIEIDLKTGGCARAIMNVADFPPSLPGKYSIENVLAAASAALILGATPEAIAEAVRNFGGVAHRMEFVREVGGVRYINNSMCTNVAAAVSSLRAIETPVIAIMGGADKELNFGDLAFALGNRAKRIVLIGSAADKIEAAFKRHGYDAISRADSLENAVIIAREFANPGDTIILSPACASFDMFRDFEERGAIFRRLVAEI